MTNKTIRSARSHAWLFALTLMLGQLPSADLTASESGGEIQPMPKGKFDVEIDKNVMVAMRDGTRLSTDIHMPVGASGKLPAILIRTPYDKRQMREIGPMWGYAERVFAEHGYVVVVQDTRGRYASEGQFTISIGDVDDTHDTVDWIAKQPWSNGKIGTHGCSYLGEIQIRSAAVSNPKLVAMLAQAAGGATGSADDRYRYFGYRTGGALEMAAALSWMQIAGSKYFFRPPPHMSRETLNRYEAFFHKAPEVPEFDMDAVLQTLPVIAMDERAGLPPTDWRDSVSRDLTDPWWDQFGYLNGKERISVPTLHMDSWPDLAVGETLYQYNLFKKNAVDQRTRDNQYLIIAPTTHCAYEWSSEQTIVGERDLGDTRFDYFGTYLRWFDYWLKDDKAALSGMPKVQYYLMGKNEWRSAESMPLPNTEYRKLYLGGGDGDAGRLGWSGPQADAVNSFTYDPKDPVPTIGGPVGTGGREQGYYDQRAMPPRKDILVYTSDPLEEGIEITGPLQAILYVSSSARDTDITAKLVEVFPDGRRLNVRDGIFRLRYHAGFDRKTPLRKDEVYEIRVDLQATALYVPAGNRLQLEVSSSNFPRFDRNLNTGGNNFDEVDGEIATNQVFHGTSRPSHLLIPVIPAHK